MEDVIIRSPNTSANLRSNELKQDCSTITMESPAIHISKTVCERTAHAQLVEISDRITVEWSGWRGMKHWNPIEGDMSLDRTHVGLGHIMLELELCEWLPEKPWMSRRIRSSMRDSWRGPPIS